ncbi:uncharacterized protein VTP21DRAFT_3077 [Calcarisporiella thermophila]|uniref:uncharacterized protein n=1 Tax=Calcarisporiella thermophila TaxID=911321 RepID=UPI0037438516
MKLKEINRTATFAWCPAQHLPYIATGTVAGALDASFSNTAELEIFRLDLQRQNSEGLSPIGSIPANARFNRLAWGYPISNKPYGILAGGLENGEVNLWNPAAILDDNSDKAPIFSQALHTGSVRGLDFNPFQHNLLASAAGNGEIYILDLNNLNKPYSPGSRSSKLEDITHLSWNCQVQHILATSSTTGHTVIWDLRNRREILHLPPGNSSMMPMHMGGAAGLRGVSAVVWNPDVATQLITASEDDSNPVISMWDLRQAHAPEKSLIGHTKGVLSVSWCKKDSELVLSCGKDCRTICWNTTSGEIIGELPQSANWSFKVDWDQTNPDIFASASFDGKINLHSLQDYSLKDSSPQNQVEYDPFSQQALGATPASATIQLKRPPKWLRRPVGATFSFGGKLVSFKSPAQNLTAPGAVPPTQPIVYTVTISTPKTEPDIVKRSIMLEEALKSDSLNSYCEAKATDSLREGKSWKLLRSLFDDNAREKLVNYLGFEKESVVDSVAAAIKRMHLGDSRTAEKSVDQSTDRGGVTKTAAASDPPHVSAGNSEPAERADLNSGQSDLFSEDQNSASSIDPFANIKPNSLDSPSIPRPPDSDSQRLFHMYSSRDSEVDRCITRAVVLGHFESAVDVCIAANRFTDALLLAICGGQELLARAQEAYFERQAAHTSYLRLLRAIIAGDLADVVDNTALEEWRETMVVLCTFARTDEFVKLCETLGHRLEQRWRQLYSADSRGQSESLDFRESAGLCYLASGNLEKVVSIWVSEIEDEERKCFSTSAGFSSRRSLLLQDLMEKVAVLRKAIDFEDPNLTHPPEDTDGQTPEYRLAPLYTKYYEYAELLASQGLLAHAMKYLDLIPTGFRSQRPTSRPEVIGIMRDRLYHSGGYITGTNAPPFPFALFQPQDQSLQNQETSPQNYYHYNEPQAAGPQDPMPHPYGPGPGLPQQPQQHEPQPPPPQQQPQPQQQQSQIQPSWGYTHEATQGSSSYFSNAVYNTPHTYTNPYSNYMDAISTASLPPPMDSVADPAASNVRELPPSQLRNQGHWNDPPMVPSPDPTRQKRQQLQGNKVFSPITAPFHNSNPIPPSDPTHPPAGNHPYVGGIAPHPPPVASPLSPPPQMNAMPSAMYGEHRPDAQSFQPPGPPAPPPTAATGGIASPLQHAAQPTGARWGVPSPPQKILSPPPPPPIHLQPAHPAHPHPHHHQQQPPQQKQQQPPPQPQQPQPAGRGRPQMHGKLAAPEDKRYPAGDRSHIPDSHKPILTILTNELVRARQNAAPHQRRVLDDTEKRLNNLFDLLNNGELSQQVVQQMLLLVQTLEARDYNTAIRIHVDLLTTKYEECGYWMVGVKRLIDTVRAF